MKYDDVTTIQYGGRLPYWKSFVGWSRRFIAQLTRNSVRISIITFRHKSRDQNTKFRKSRWRTAAILKKFLRYISAENHPISTKFCVQMQILVPIIATSQNIKFLQIQYGGRPPYWKSFLCISQRYIMRLTWNLAWRSKIMFWHKQATWPKYQISKIQAGGRPPF